MLKTLAGFLLVVALVAAVACTATAPQPASPTNAPAASQPAAAPAAVAGNPNPPAENDPQRTQWRIDVAPYAGLGSGHPGKADEDFDKPDGVAFTPQGLLLATDAKNRRVQVWDVKTHTRVGEFGHHHFGGEIVDIAVAPSGLVLVTDQNLNLAYALTPPEPGAVDPETGKPLGPADYTFRGTRFGEQGFEKLGGIAIDSKNRIYCVDAHKNEVRRFKPDCTPDPTWHFEKTGPTGDTYLHGCEGIAINETTGDLFVSSEKDAVIQVFAEETGKYKGRMIGAKSDGSGKPQGKHVFFASVEGLAIAGNFLLAVDEAAGHIQMFEITKQGTFNEDLLQYSTPALDRSLGYVGFFGHAPLVDLEDKTKPELLKQVKDGTVVPGQVNPLGYFCSPDSISAYVDKETNDTYVAIADQCNYRIAVYKLSDVLQAAGPIASNAGETAVALVPHSHTAAPKAQPQPRPQPHRAPPPQPRRVTAPAPPPKPAKEKGKHGHHAA